jgi:polyphosphate kinase 2 (PPK2 family)
MPNSLKDFRVKEGSSVDLDKWPTDVKHIYQSKDDYRVMLAQHVEQLSSLQQLLYASNSYAVLLIFQAMDAAGKDGVIRHVMSGVNPQGCQVFSFKHPRIPRNCCTTSCGAPPATCRNAAASAFSTVPITRKS